MTGVHFAYKQSIMVGMMSSLCWMVWEMKLVSTSTEYGGVRAVLYWKKRDDGAWGLLKEIPVSFSPHRYLKGTGTIRFSNHIVFGFAFLFVFLVLLPALCKHGQLATQTGHSQSTIPQRYCSLGLCEFASLLLETHDVWLMKSRKRYRRVFLCLAISGLISPG